MIYESRSVILKNGEAVILRSPTPDDAAEMLDFLKSTAAETEFMLRYPEECTMTLYQEISFLQGILDSPNELMILCEVNGKIVGSCHISFNSFFKTMHRATVAIAILQSHWNKGLGTIMFDEMINTANKRGIHQLELDVIEGNHRAMALYEKMGFRVRAERPDSIRLKDGTMLKEFIMIKTL